MPTSISTQRMAMMRPDPGWTPISRNTGPRISSSRKPILSAMSDTATRKISTPVTMAAMRAPIAMPSLLVQSLPWKRKNIGVFSSGLATSSSNLAWWEPELGFWPERCSWTSVAWMSSVLAPNVRTIAALGSAVPNSPISQGLQTSVDHSASAFWATPGVPLWP